MKRILKIIGGAVAAYGAYLLGFTEGLEYEYEYVEDEEPLEEFPDEVNRWRMGEELAGILTRDRGD